MELDSDEKTYLSVFYECEAKRQKISLRQARAQTRKSVSAEFSPRVVQQKYLRGTRLTLPAIFLLNPNDPMIKKTDAVANEIRDLLAKDPDRQEFSAVELASKSGMTENDARLCLEYLTDLHLVNSGNSSGEAPGWNKIYVNSEDNLEAFYNYSGIKASLHSAIKSIAEYRTFILPRSDDSPDNLPARIMYRKNTAFIMMSMDPSNPKLEGVVNCFKEVCSSFGILAERADDVEHSGMITELVLERIDNSEILIADLTGERPNVYYEIGYAHALGKRPVLFRELGTRLHFDLSVYNVPEYRNVTELRTLVTTRLEAITGRKPRK